MKKPFLLGFLFLLTALLAVGVGWYVGQHRPLPFFASAQPGTTAAAAASAPRKALFYQSPMHPWIKSDKPGKCTICGMDMVPVYADAQSQPLRAPDTAAAATDPGLLKLSANSVQVAGIQTETVQRGTLAKSLEVAGTVEDDETQHRLISAYTSGRVEKLNVRFVGAEVTSGQPLATLYSPDIQIAEGELLLAAKSAGDRVGGVKGAREKLRRFGLTEAQIAVIEKRGTVDHDVEILSPIGGTVIERNVYEGQWVNYGEKLFALADFSTMWFQFDAYERDIPWLKVGQPVEVTSDAAPGKVFNARIDFIDPNFNEMTRSTKVRVEIKDCPLPHRVYARGRVLVNNTDADALLVPRSAVLRTGERAVAYLEREPGVYAPRALKLGRIGDRNYEVLDGLNEGDRVVTSGNLLLDAQAQLGREVASTDPAR